MAVERISSNVGDKIFIGALIYDERASGKRPLLLITPNWLGMPKEAIERTQSLTGSCFIGFVADMYGQGKASDGPREAAQLADSLRADVKERRARIVAALATLVAESEKRGIGDATRKVAMGFCFGGGNVLELARSGADLQAAICLYGDLEKPAPAEAGDIKAAMRSRMALPARPRRKPSATRSNARWRRPRRSGKCTLSAMSCTLSASRKPTWLASPNITKLRHARPIE